MRKRYIATILTAFGVVAYLAMDDSHEPIKVQNGNTQRAEPDYIINDLSAENYGKDGKLTQQIDAIKATHFPDSDTTVLTEPSVVVHKNDLPRWGIRSNTGSLKSNPVTTRRCINRTHGKGQYLKPQYRRVKHRLR